MKYIPMTELKVGDLFCEEMKLKGRKAFLVDSINNDTLTCINNDTLTCIDRDTQIAVSKKIKGSVAFFETH